MKKVLFVFVFLVVSSFASMALAVPELQLPFESGVTLNVTRAYNTPKTHLNKDLYALDFAGNGCSSFNLPILAVANGTIEVVNNNASASLYGKYVEINHGGGYVTKYAHLNSTSVQVGEYVYQGHEIGKMGNTGNVVGTTCPDYPGLHLHFAMYYNSAAHKPETISGYYGITQGNELTSLNFESQNYKLGKYSNGYVYEGTSDYRPFSRPFSTAYKNNGESSMFGSPANNVHLMDTCYGCDGYGADFVYVQDFQGGALGSSTLVMNMLTYNIRFNYLGVVYPIHGQLRDYWYLNYSDLGAPVTNEYIWNDGYQNYTVQWFEPSDNDYVAVVYNANNQTFRQCNVSSYDCPPYDQNVFDQAQWTSTGCANGDCGVGGDGTEAVVDDYVFVDTYVCDSWQHGTGDEYWNLVPINVHSDFISGETAQFLVKLEDVYVDHRYKMELYRNGSILREQTTPWNDLDPGQSWTYSSFAPYQQNLMPGNYTVNFYLDTGSGFSILDFQTFTVSGPDYVYSGLWTCDGWEYGSTDPNSPVYWDWQPVNPRTSFNNGDTVYLLAQLDDVFIDHEWKMEVWKDGSFQWTWPSGWVDVDNVNGWGYSNFAPYIENVSAGNYELKLYLDDGSGFSLIDTKPFSVSAFTENIPYVENFSTDDHRFTLEDHLSTAALSISQTGGISGSICLLLTNNQSVQPYQVQAKKVGFNLVNNTSYTGSIKIRGDGTGTVYVLFERAVSPWDNLGLWRIINVTDVWQTIDLNFTATGNPELDSENVRFTIQAGSFVGDLYIDDISLN